ncbi:hypothetical protein G6F50_016819 [Rhizopus delemar]|uniref:S-formylglutathione hydrolase n=1 Tax=Rhizopus delemar TaxID=936053 RepID=A0A9P6XRX8_9FUNG|nr:hypothetical protein G6F50_016819 [Rhizopus delemar]
MIVAPDTSPRGDDGADAEGYDLGKGAGFYLNATRAPWAQHYRMHDYVAQELPALIEANFPATGARAISGHSMGGHGALMIALPTCRGGRRRSTPTWAITRPTGRSGIRARWWRRPVSACPFWSTRAGPTSS